MYSLRKKNKWGKTKKLRIKPEPSVVEIPKRSTIVGDTLMYNPYTGQSEIVPVTEGWVRKTQSQDDAEYMKNRADASLDQFFAPELQDATPMSQVTTNRGTIPRKDLVSPWNRRRGGRKTRKVKKGKGKSTRRH